MTRRPLPKTLPAGRRAARHVPPNVQIRADAWTNMVTGLGVEGSDWRTADRLVADRVMTQQEIDIMYAQDSLAANMVDCLPEDACRRWIHFTGGHNDETVAFQGEIFKHFQRLQVKSKFIQWLKKGRKDGGALMLIGTDDLPKDVSSIAGNDPYATSGPLARPLNEDGIGEIRHLHILERIAVVPGPVDNDPLSDTYNHPVFYMLVPRALRGKKVDQAQMRNWVRIHSSRVFAHEGVQVSEWEKINNLGWGYSCLQRPRESIKNYRMFWGHIAMTFKHVAQTVLKLDGYAQLKGADFAGTVDARIAELQRQRSSGTMVILDKEDELVDQTINGIQGALTIFKYCQEDLSQTSGMPLTKLFGHTTSGIGTNDDAAGERNWYDTVRAAQEEYLLAPLTRLTQLLVKAYGIAEPDGWALDFIPLNEPTDGEVADVRLKRAQEAQIYVTSRVLEPSEVRDTLRADPDSTWTIGDGDATDFPADDVAAEQAAAKMTMKAPTGSAAGKISAKPAK